MSDRPKTPERLEAERTAELAWSAYAALLRIETNVPGLRANPFWQPLKDTAHARFRAIFESEAMK